MSGTQCLWVRIIHWCIGNLQGSTFLKKDDSLCPNSHQLLIAPQQGRGLMSPFIFHTRGFMCLDFVHIWCRSCEFMLCSSHVMCRGKNFKALIFSVLFFFPLLFQDVPKLCWDEELVEMLHRWPSTHSLQFSLLWTFFLSLNFYSFFSSVLWCFPSVGGADIDIPLRFETQHLFSALLHQFPEKKAFLTMAKGNSILITGLCVNSVTVLSCSWEAHFALPLDDQIISVGSRTTS